MEVHREARRRVRRLLPRRGADGAQGGADGGLQARRGGGAGDEGGAAAAAEGRVREGREGRVGRGDGEKVGAENDLRLTTGVDLEAAGAGLVFGDVRQRPSG